MSSETSDCTLSPVLGDSAASQGRSGVAYVRARLAAKRAEERGEAHAATVLTNWQERTYLRAVPDADVESASWAIAEAAAIVRKRRQPALVPFVAAPANGRYVPVRWDRLVWAIREDGAGKSEAFDQGFRACLRALGVEEADIEVLFREGIES